MSTTKQMFFDRSSAERPHTVLATNARPLVARPLVRRDSQQIASCHESFKQFKRCSDGDSELLQCDSVVKSYMRCMLGQWKNEDCN
eukprot:scaffold4797_cov152-Skeletonema_marinoi.AAC.7